MSDALMRDLDLFREHLRDVGGAEMACDEKRPDRRVLTRRQVAQFAMSIARQVLDRWQEVRPESVADVEKLDPVQRHRLEFWDEMVRGARATALVEGGWGPTSFEQMMRRDPVAFIEEMVRRSNDARWLPCRCDGVTYSKQIKCRHCKHAAWAERALEEMEHLGHPEVELARQMVEGDDSDGYASGHGGIRSSGGSSGHPDRQPDGDEAEGEA